MIKESSLKQSRGWKYKELSFTFEEYKQISMFEGWNRVEGDSSKKRENSSLWNTNKVR